MEATITVSGAAAVDSSNIKLDLFVLSFLEFIEMGRTKYNGKVFTLRDAPEFAAEIRKVYGFQRITLKYED